MILACHTLIYSDDADATRAFFRDVLGFPNVDAGTGDHNWLIFGTGPSELGVHPTDPPGQPRHQITFMCDDITATLADLKAKGAEVTQDIRNDPFGQTAVIEVPGGAGEMMIYQPRHASAFDID